MIMITIHVQKLCLAADKHEELYIYIYIYICMDNKQCICVYVVFLWDILNFGRIETVRMAILLF